MRVLFDLQALQTQSSRSRGIGFYTRNHVAALASLPGLELDGLVNGWLPTGDSLDRLLATLSSDPAVRLTEGDRLRDVEERDEHHRKAVESGVAAHAVGRGCSIYHCTSPFEWEVWVPSTVRHVRVVATVYDLIPHLFPGEYLSGASPRFRYEYQRILDGLRQADRLLAISDCTKRDLVTSLDIPADRVHVVWAAADARFRVVADPDPDGTVRERWRTGRRFVLYTGGYDFRKNFERLFEAFAASRARRTHRLVVVCRLTDDERRRVRAMGEAAGLGEELVLTGFVPDDDQVLLYNLADLLVFPSRYEGFGLPVLEAMKCGIPVICSSVSSMPEIAGDAAVLVDPLDPRAMREAIDGVLENPERAAQLRSRGARQAAKFTWDAVARATLQAYREVAVPPPRPWSVGSVPPTRMRIALFTPLPPAASGIADFAGELLPTLSERADVTAFVDAPDAEPLCTPAWRVEDGRLFEVVDRDVPFTHVVHQIGNSLHHEQAYRHVLERGGVVLLHDLVLHHLVMATTLDRGDERAYRDELVLAHGREGSRVAALVALGFGSDAFYYQLGCLRRLLDRADAIATFSAHAAGRVRELGYTRPLARLPLSVAGEEAPTQPAVARRALGIDPDAFWIGSFGVQTPMKRPEAVLRAFGELRRLVPRARLVFVGEIPPWARLQERVGSSPDASAITITGRIDADRYRAWMDACDAIVALRYPHRGETSAAALKAMERGRPVLASDLGAMSEVPATAFLPIDVGAREHSHLTATLRALADDRDLGRAVGARARHYVLERHSPARTADRLVEFLAELPPRADAAGSGTRP
ncbi:MAG: glycosyltransferase [Deltaproteobacteria bacterium]|nr:glycosyltransferase [Deltaproteobacteria bacterium]